MLSVGGEELQLYHLPITYTTVPNNTQNIYKIRTISLRQIYIYRCYISWRSGATGRVLDLQLTGRGFRSYSGQSCVTTLGKLFTPIYASVTKQYNLVLAKGAVMLCGWEGNHRLAESNGSLPPGG